MAKLTNLKPSLARLSGFGAFEPAPRADAERERLARRDQTVAWHGWYKTQRWYDLRRRVFARDKYTCQKTGVLLYGKYPAPNSPVADHKIPHRGDPKLFWDINNLQTVSKQWHDTVKQAQERADAAKASAMIP